nr:27kDa protein [Agapanthus velarivirus]QVY19213.1 27kDa protein [Agapanthus velarivirus]
MESSTYEFIKSTLHQSLTELMSGNNTVDECLATLTDVVIPAIDAIDRPKLVMEYRDNLILAFSQNIPIELAREVLKDYRYSGISKYSDACEHLKNLLEFVCYRRKTGPAFRKYIMNTLIRDCEDAREIRQDDDNSDYRRSISYRLIRKMTTNNEHSVAFADELQETIDDSYADLVEKYYNKKIQKIKDSQAVRQFIDDCQTVIDDDRRLLVSVDVLGYHVPEHARYEVRKMLHLASTSQPHSP